MVPSGPSHRARAYTVTLLGRRPTLADEEPRSATRPWKLGLPVWVAIPGLVYYALFFLTPIVIVVVIAMGEPVGYGGVTLTFSGQAFSQVLSPVFLSVFRRTLLFATFGTGLVLLAGFPAAYWIARYGARRKLLLVALLVIPFWTSFLLRAYAFLIMFGDDWFLVRFLHALGFDDVSLVGTNGAVFVVLVYTYLPLAVLPLFASLERMDWRLVEAARDLGASGWGAFRQVTLPSVRRGVATGMLLVFVPMTGEYAVPQIVGSGTSVLYANLVGQQFLAAQNWPLGAALAVFLIVVVGSVSLVVLLAQRDDAR